MQDRYSTYLLLLSHPLLKQKDTRGWDDIQTKVLRVFLLAIHRHLYSFALRFLFLSKSRNLLQFSQFSFCTL